MLRGLLLILVIGVAALIAAIMFGFIDVSQTRTAELPKITVEGGQAPAFAVNTADVSLGSTAKTVDVPKIEVGTTKQTVEMPSVDVKRPQ